MQITSSSSSVSDWIGFSQGLFKMYPVVILIFVEIIIVTLCSAESPDCTIVCPPENMQCAFDMKGGTYKLFSSKCAMANYSSCHKIDFVQTPLKYCLKFQVSTRRLYGESCPVFCPNHYRPVCAAAKYRSYNYRTFNNGCYLDMINCRGEDDFTSYIEVPLQFCQRHHMKNIYKEQVVVSGLRDYEDY